MTKIKNQKIKIQKLLKQFHFLQTKIAAKPVKKVSSNGPKKVIKKSVKKEIKKENPKTELSKENKAAIIIQKNVRRFVTVKVF